MSKINRMAAAAKKFELTLDIIYIIMVM